MIVNNLLKPVKINQKQPLKKMEKQPFIAMGDQDVLSNGENIDLLSCDFSDRSKSNTRSMLRRHDSV